MSRPRAQSTKSTTPARLLPFHWSYFLLAAFLAFFAWKYIEKTHEVQGLARQEAALRYENQQVLTDNIRTRHAIANASTMQYVQDTARASLGYTMPGETSVEVTPRVQHRVARTLTPTRPAAPPAPSWQQWWNSFFG